MRFMGWICEAYSTPFILLDGYISTCRFSEFVHSFSESHDEAILWEIYLHKLGAWSEEGWDEFKARNMRVRADAPNIEEVAGTVDESFTILNSFDPTKGG